MRKAALAAILFLCFAVVAVKTALWRTQGTMQTEGFPIARHEHPADRAGERLDGQHLETAYLYFFHDNGVNLSAEARKILTVDGAPVRRGEMIINSLIQGPRSALKRSVPEKTRLNALYVTPDGIAYVDLSEDIVREHPGGASTELLTLYSMANSLILNLPEIDAVKFLINGRGALTLAGHIDMRYPFYAQMRLIR